MLLILQSCNSNRTSSPENDVAQKHEKQQHLPENGIVQSQVLLTMRLQEYPELKNLKSLGNFIIKDKVMYMIYENKLIKVFLESKEVKRYYEVEKLFLKRKNTNILNGDYFFDINLPASELIALTLHDSAYIINVKSNTVENKIALISMLPCYIDKEGNFLQINEDYSSIKLIGKNGEAIDEKKFEFSASTFIHSKTGICFLNQPMNPINEFNVVNNKIQQKVYPSVSSLKQLKNVEQFYLALNTEDYFVGFDYKNRSRIYKLKKSNNQLDLVFTINNDMANSNIDYVAEEGEPNMKIRQDGDKYYIVQLNDDELIISRF